MFSSHRRLQLVLIYLLAHGLEPHLLVHPRLEPEFDGLPTGGPMAVVVGDAGDAFTYGALNDAFRRLVDGAEFLALARNRMFTEPDGPSLDAGPFVVALEYACTRSARLLGKPAPAFFLSYSGIWVTRFSGGAV
jgi:ribonucleotide monophosphatase NagD (HAD superfamily)